MLNQFQNYLNNQLTNILIEEDEKLPFEEVKAVREESIYMIADTEKGEYKFYYNCYATLESGKGLYDFELV